MEIGLIFANIIGWFVSHKRYVLYAVAGIALLVLTVLVMKSCKPKAKLNEVEIQRGEQAVKERNDKELREILINSEVREKLADDTAKAGEEKSKEIINESVNKWSNASRDELQAEFDRRKQ